VVRSGDRYQVGPVACEMSHRGPSGTHRPGQYAGSRRLWTSLRCGATAHFQPAIRQRTGEVHIGMERTAEHLMEERPWWI
jgi:hypothetical protein